MSPRSLFLDHLWLKGFSLILATLIWLTIRANLNREAREETHTFRNESVGLMHDVSEHRIYVIDPPQVSVTVKGPKVVIDSLRDIQAYVDLSNHAGNTGNYNVEVQAPAGISVVVVTPRTVFVRQSGEGP